MPNDNLIDRVMRERAYYEKVFRESAALQRRLRHVFDNPNIDWAESLHRSNIIAAVRGRHVLDYGCGTGESTAELLNFGAARVTGVDLSDSAIDTARRRSLNNASFLACDAHCLPWVGPTFDVVVGRAILHHLDTDLASKELIRVIKPSGECFFVEPLAGNPGARLFRALTPRARTIDEHPLTRDDVTMLDSRFGRADHHFALFSTMALGALTSWVSSLRADNPMSRLADQVDRRVMRTPLRWWMGQIYLHWWSSK